MTLRTLGLPPTHPNPSLTSSQLSSRGSVNSIYFPLEFISVARSRFSVVDLSGACFLVIWISASNRSIMVSGYEHSHLCVDQSTVTTGRPLLWTNSLPRKTKKNAGEFGFYERTESCYDLTSWNFDGRHQLVKCQSGLIVPPRGRKKNNVSSRTSLVRTQSGVIVPPRLNKSRSNLLLSDVTVKSKKERVPPTPPKRRKHLQIEKINELFMNLVNSNGQERMQLGIESKWKCNSSCFCPPRQFNRFLKTTFFRLNNVCKSFQDTK